MPHIIRLNKFSDRQPKSAYIAKESQHLREIWERKHWIALGLGTGPKKAAVGIRTVASVSVSTGELSREQRGQTVKKGSWWLCEVISWGLQDCLQSGIPFGIWVLHALGPYLETSTPLPLSFCSHTSEEESDSKDVTEGFRSTAVQRILFVYLFAAEKATGTRASS